MCWGTIVYFSNQYWAEESDVHFQEYPLFDGGPTKILTVMLTNFSS